jgi:predicted nucleic acid-binding protein
MFLDTSGLLSLLDRREPHHKLAEGLYVAASSRLTHSYVLSEFVALAQARRFNRLSTLEYVRDLLVDPDVETVWVDQMLHEEGLDLLLHRLDKSYSLCDAVSFVLMHERGIQDALTTDHHFEQEGLTRLLK